MMAHGFEKLALASDAARLPQSKSETQLERNTPTRGALLWQDVRADGKRSLQAPMQNADRNSQIFRPLMRSKSGNSVRIGRVSIGLTKLLNQHMVN
jgi:hypothetical protein